MKYYTGSDYPHVCPDCQAAISGVALFCSELPDEYASYEEGPLMYAGDNGLLCNCGGTRCAGNLDDE